MSENEEQTSLNVNKTLYICRRGIDLCSVMKNIDFRLIFDLLLLDSFDHWRTYHILIYGYNGQGLF